MLFKELLSTLYLPHNEIGSIANSETARYQVRDFPVNINGLGSDHLLTYLFFPPQEYCDSENQPSQRPAFQHIYQVMLVCMPKPVHEHKFWTCPRPEEFGEKRCPWQEEVRQD